MKPLVGSDPELFVGRDGNVLTAIGLIGGSKDSPLAVPLGALQEDNVLLEYNIDPASSFEEFQRNILGVLEEGRSALAKHGLDVIRGLSSHIYDESTLMQAGEQAWVFGCEPDYNAWTKNVNEMPRDVHPFLRTAGGHLHIGFDHIMPVTKAESRKVVKMCDLLLGLPSVLLDPDEERKQLYGKAGACRLKPYGPEYRTLSNFWLFSNDLIKWAYDGAVAAFERREELDAMEAFVSSERIQQIINSGDKHEAEAACKILGVAV
ncbi:COOH.NH2 ligase [Pseudomonas phage tf]|jgi:hypothetical protein|uniref:COOH.NH2 ligase-type 2 n=1 Tax=Pseudomonas phage tf TaxID=1114179 RepID=I2FLP0_9CAUD|nr:COOH.NH2 ligase [Pseudomonas phage tf]CCE60774.1 hypothetical protein tf_19 [Pseudomonas phage tf]